jgi:hypothetical protein
MKTALPPAALAAAGLGVAALLYVMAQRRAGQSLAGAAGSAAVEAVADASTGAVIGLGEVFGIPATDTDQCSIDLANGDLWAASFSCPAKRFLAAVVGSDTPPPDSTGGATGSW